MSWDLLAAENYRGVRVPRVLGLGVFAATAVVAGVEFLTHDPGSRATALRGWIPLAACGLVLAVGLVDDVAPAGPRGLRGHLRALASGHMTTGILKVLVIGAASIVSVAAMGGGGLGRKAAGVVLLASSANLWNGLDVRPGRALKAFVVVAIFVVASGAPWRMDAIVAGTLAGAVVALWPDLRERAMLGDGGSNLLGFVVGLFLAAALPEWVLLAAAAMMALNVLAETITLSRIIDRTPPLRWIDRLGRLP